ncbi:MAG: peptidylprolyl isomerase [Deltaproteobacteria bacterium]|nr:peptidylprolyl isomerase [Deltaproteobacteria bacterium]
MNLRLLPLILLAALGCRRAAPPPPGPPPSVADAPAQQAGEIFADASVTGAPPPGAPSLALAVAAVAAEARRPALGDLAKLATPSSVARLVDRTTGANADRLPLTAGTVLSRFAGKILQVDYAGGRAAVVALTPGAQPQTSWFYYRNGRWLLDLADARSLRPAWTGPESPENHPVSLAEAWTPSGDPREPLVATFRSPQGRVRCLLHDRQVPEVVAHFVGLATGARASRRAEARTMENIWEHKRFYDGTAIYRALPGRRIEAGDPFDLGTGHAGFRLPDRFDLNLRHATPGVLGLLPLGPHATSSIFYITLQPEPEFDDHAVIFGLCRDLEVVDRWSRQPKGSIRIQTIDFSRGWPDDPAVGN